MNTYEWEDPTEDYNIFEQRQLDLELEAERQGDEELQEEPRMYEIAYRATPDEKWTLLHCESREDVLAWCKHILQQIDAVEFHVKDTRKRFRVCLYVQDWKILEEKFNEREVAIRYAQNYQGKWTNKLADRTQSYQYTHGIVFNDKGEVVQLCDFHVEAQKEQEHDSTME